ncbi:signal transduction histidine kinase [Candidatus Magnetoovum chiemensis]|nr:signal transduction histidine kinase [Candidatus Magnetoovum chiemensis]
MSDICNIRCGLDVHEKGKMLEDNSRQCRLSISEKRLSDYAMVCDLLSSITVVMSEDEAIEKIISIFRSLCAPSYIIYITVMDGQPSKVTISAKTMESRPSAPNIIENCKDDYSWTPSGKGFRLQIKHRENLLGVIEIDGVSFPEYLQHYVNLSLNIAGVLALSISNARTYQALNELNKNLALKVDEETTKRINQERILIQQSKMAIMGEMIGAIAHQWKQPLNH